MYESKNLQILSLCAQGRHLIGQTTVNILTDDAIDEVFDVLPKLLAVVEAAKELDESRYANRYGLLADEQLIQLRKALKALKEDV